YMRLIPRYDRNFFFRLYRRPIEWLEQLGIRAADRILVNSCFTAARLRRAYPRLDAAPMEVVYPGVDPRPYRERARPGSDRVTLVSLNRLVPYKNIGLAIEALALARAALAPEIFRRVRLVLAGAYDDRLGESRGVLSELKDMVARFGLTKHTVFKLSCSE